MDDVKGSVEETVSEMISTKDYNAIIQLVGDLARREGVAICPNIMASLPSRNKFVAQLNDHVLLEKDRDLFGELTLGWHLAVIRRGEILHLERVKIARTSKTFEKDVWRLTNALQNYYGGVGLETELFAVHHRFGFLSRWQTMNDFVEKFPTDELR